MYAGLNVGSSWLSLRTLRCSGCVGSSTTSFEAHLLCGRDGNLRLHSVEVSAWQAVDLARKWGDTSRKPDTGTDKQLRALFTRVGVALQAWVELTDHLLHAR